MFDTVNVMVSEYDRRDCMEAGVDEEDDEPDAK